jgi:hypothetical protein
MSPTRRPSVFSAASDRLVFSHAPMLMKTPLTQRAFSLVTAKTTKLRQPGRSPGRAEATLAGLGQGTAHGLAGDGGGLQEHGGGSRACR